MKPKLKLAIAGLVLAGLVAATRFLDIQDDLRSWLRSVEELGPWGPLAFILIYVVATVLFVPGFLLSLGAGILFGVVRGSMFVLCGATLGATCSFLIARHIAQDWIAGKIAANPRFSAVDKAIAGEGWKIVGMLRLSPLFPFNFLNYALGLTRVSLRDYFLATVVGMLPGTVVYVYVGSLIGDLGSLGSGPRTRTPAEWAFYAMGLVVTTAVTVYVTRIARRNLANHIRA